MNVAAYAVLAAARALLSKKADVVLFMTDPPFFPLLGAALKFLRGEKIVYILMDLYPEVAFRAGALREGSAAGRALRRLARGALRAADAVVVLGEDMREAALRAGAEAGRVVIIPNWADPEAIRPVSHGENPFRKGLGLDGKFVVAYSGNFGVSHDFSDLLAIAAEWPGDPDIRFLLIGGGARREEVENTAKGLSNVLLLPYQDGSRLSETLSAGDVHFVSLRPGFEGLVVPSKAYGIMAAGRPILYQGDPQGEIARMVAREGIGAVVLPGDREGLREAILAFKSDPSRRAQTGEAARKALIERYSAKTGLSRYRETIHAAAGIRGASTES
jgi:glycosyltransferase involved in cell wall biosynthesis